MVDLRSDLVEARSKNAVLEKELQNTFEQLHTAQLQIHASSGHGTTAESVRKKLVPKYCCKFTHDLNNFSQMFLKCLFNFVLDLKLKVIGFSNV